MGKPKNFGLATNTRNIGNVYEATGDLDLALSCYYQAMKNKWHLLGLSWNDTSP